MTSPSTRRSKVTRPDGAWTRWLAAAAILFASGVAAGLVAALGGATSASCGAGLAVLVCGGALAARALRPRLELGSLIGLLMLPVPTTLAVAVAVIPFADGVPGVAVVVLRLYAICELSLVVAAGVLVVARRRAETRLALAGWPPGDIEVAAATDTGRAEVVVREYPDTTWGRSTLHAERRRFAAHDYVLVDLGSQAGAADGAATLELLLPIHPVGLDTSSRPAIVATFKRAGRSEP